MAGHRLRQFGAELADQGASRPTLSRSKTRQSPGSNPFRFSERLSIDDRTWDATLILIPDAFHAIPRA